MDTSRAEIERLRAALSESKEEAETIRQRLDDIQRIRIIRLRLYLARDAASMTSLAKAVGVVYTTLYRKLGLWADQNLCRRLEPGEEVRIVAAADLPTLDLPAQVGVEAVRRLVTSIGVEITRDELAEAIGADTAAALFEGGHLTINERGHVAPGRKG